MGALRKSDYVSKHIVLEKYVVGDMRFYRFILLVDNSPNALDWRILPREGRWPDLFCLRQRWLWLRELIHYFLWGHEQIMTQYSSFCSARWIWHLFISRRCYAVYDLRRQAPTTTTTRIPDPRTYLPPAGCPTSFFYPPGCPKREKKKKYATNFPPFSLRLPFQLHPV